MYNSVDIICGAILLILGLFGYHTGAIASVFYVASGFVGVFVAQKYATNLHVNFVVLFLAVTLGLIAFGMFSRAMARLFLLGFFDRAAGFIIGALLGVALLAVALEPAAEKFSEPMRIKIHNSYTAKRLLPKALAAIPALKDISDGRFQFPGRKEQCK